MEGLVWALLVLLVRLARLARLVRRVGEQLMEVSAGHLLLLTGRILRAMLRLLLR